MVRSFGKRNAGNSGNLPPQKITTSNWGPSAAPQMAPADSDGISRIFSKELFQGEIGAFLRSAGFSPDAPGNIAQTAAGPRLQREFHRLPAADPGSAAVREMLAHPTGRDPDYRNPWPPGTSLRVPVTSTADASTVDLTEAPPSDLAAQELVFTVQGALGSTAPVHLLHDGTPTGPPIPRGDPYALRSLVQIDAPADGTSTTSPVTVTGEAAVFEATLHWAVLSGATTISTGVASTEEGQVFAPFRFAIDLPPGHYTVRISEDDPSDGAGRPVLTDDRTVTVT
jgi:hypothetical protein